MRYFFYCLLILGVSACKSPSMEYVFTENTPKTDTFFILKDATSYNDFEENYYQYWNDTIIYLGIKIPPTRDPQAGRLNHDRYMGNIYNDDSVHITFDKYKATKVDIRRSVFLIDSDSWFYWIYGYLGILLGW